VAIMTVYRHKTGSMGPAYLTVHDMRLVRIMELYVEHVRPKFLKLHKDEDNPPDPENGVLTVFLDRDGNKCKKIDSAVTFFKRQIIDAGQPNKFNSHFQMNPGNRHKKHFLSFLKHRKISEIFK
jgi:hypothetical protein